MVTYLLLLSGLAEKNLTELTLKLWLRYGNKLLTDEKNYRRLLVMERGRACPRPTPIAHPFLQSNHASSQMLVCSTLFDLAFTNLPTTSILRGFSPLSSAVRRLLVRRLSPRI